MSGFTPVAGPRIQHLEGGAWRLLDPSGRAVLTVAPTEPTGGADGDVYIAQPEG